MERQKKTTPLVSGSAADGGCPLTIHLGRLPWRALAEDKPYTDPYELLVGDNEAAVRSLLLASSVADRAAEEEADKEIIPATAEGFDRASDYDKFLALCTAIPRWAGHPLYAAMHGVLTRLTGCALSLTAANAPQIWRDFVEKTAARPLGMRRALAELGVGTVCLCVSPETWQHLPADVWTRFDGAPAVYPQLYLDESSTSAYRDPADMTAAITAMISDGAALGLARVVCRLPDGWRFVRPHPYGAGEAMKKAAAGRRPSDEERYLLYTQLLRIVGQACATEGVELAVHGGRSAEVGRLVDYLISCGGHRALRYTPTAAGDVDGLLGMPGVSFGLPLSASDTPRILEDKVSLHAAHAPLGAWAGLDIPVHSLTDVWMLSEARRVTYARLAAWAEEGLAPQDPEAWHAVIARS